jgi:hypothetical protein
VSYNASAVKIYYGNSSLVRSENKNIFFYFEKRAPGPGDRAPAEILIVNHHSTQSDRNALAWQEKGRENVLPNISADVVYIGVSFPPTADH